MKLKKDRTPFDVFPSYKGGHTCLMGGYILEFHPFHREANMWGWVFQHRLVGEDMVGRPLVWSTKSSEKECVHHKNEIRTDNRPENLEVMTFSAHRSYHTKKMNDEKRVHLTPSIVSEALKKTGNIKAAAKHLGVAHQTLRLHFDEILAPYMRTRPVDLSCSLIQKQLAEVAWYFAPTHISYSELAKLTQIATPVWKKILAEHKICWKPGPTGGLGKRLVYRGQPTPYAKELYGSSIAPGDERLRTVAERATQPKVLPRRGKILAPAEGLQV
jgi:hypothetical protein